MAHSSLSFFPHTETYIYVQYHFLKKIRFLKDFKACPETTMCTVNING